MITPISPVLPMRLEPIHVETELRAALELLDRHELQKIIQVVYETAGGLQ